ncbi:MAG: hypothetical protein RIC38_05600 [Chromatocurvus sp.]
MLLYPADVRLESLDDYSACFERKSGITHILDAAAAFILQQAITQPGIDRDAMLEKLQHSFDDGPEALTPLLDKSLALLLRQGLLFDTDASDDRR